MKIPITKKDIDSLNNSDIQLFASEFGVENTDKLIELFGGSTIYIPMLDTITRKVGRNQLIICDYLKGLSYKTLSRKYGISERQIRRIIKNRR